MTNAQRKELERQVAAGGKSTIVRPEKAPSSSEKKRKKAQKAKKDAD